MTNIVYIMVDDLGFADLNPVHMPRSHALMEQLGTQLSFQTAEKCAPSRGALMTGVHPEKLDLTRSYPAQEYPGIDPAREMLSERFQDAGYATGLFGKWHLGVEPEQGPWNQGFDHSIGLTHGQVFYFGLPDGPDIGIERYPNSIIGHSHNRGHDMLLNGTPIHTGQYSTTLFEESSRAWIREKAAAEEDFFAYIPLNAPHTPFSAPRAYVDQYVDQFGITPEEYALLQTYEGDVLGFHGTTRVNADQATRDKLDGFLYYAAVRAMDDAVANIYQEIIDAGVADDTLFMFASDNGGRQNYGDNGPLRGSKGSEYEGAHRVANFIIWPEEISPGETIDQNIWIGDLYPTFLSIAGIDYGTGLDGVDVSDALRGDASFDRGVIFPHTRVFRKEIVVSVLDGDIKYISRINVSRDSDGNVTTINRRSEELYDLSSDIGETTNVVDAPQYAAALAALRAAYDGFGENGLTGEDYFLSRNVNLEGLPPDPPEEWGSPLTSDDPRIIKYGTAGNDVMTGEPDADTFMGVGGNDTINGGSGNDTVAYLGDMGDFTLTLHRSGEVNVRDRSGGEGDDSLNDVEMLSFATGASIFGDGTLDLRQFDGIVRLTADQISDIVELYVAYFNRAPDAVGLNFWGTVLANGTPLEEIAQLFLNQDETRALYPSDATNQDFAEQVYSNVLGRAPDQAGLDFWVPLLDSAEVSRGTFILEVLKGAKTDAPAGSSPREIGLRNGDQSYLSEKTLVGGNFAVVNGMSDVSDANAVMDLVLRGDGSFGRAALARIAEEQAAAEANAEFLMPLVGYGQFTLGGDTIG